MTYRKI
jgi:hypothetical protein